MRRIACLVVLGGLLVADQAAAAQNATILTSLNADGSGGMSVDPAAKAWSWQACSANGSGCAPFASGQRVGTGAASPGTVFVARASDGSTARSPVWHGNVSSKAPPAVGGALRANALVTPVAGTWSGGWAGDFDQLQLAACTSPQATDCTPLSDPPYYVGCAHEAAVIDVGFTGRYLRVADRRLGVNTVFPALALLSPFGSQAWPTGPTTSAAIVGRIAPASGPRTARCGPPPLISATLSDHGVAKVRCGVACVVVLRVQRKRFSARVEQTLPRPGSATIRMPLETRRNLGRAKALFSLEVDGRLFAKRTVKQP